MSGSSWRGAPYRVQLSLERHALGVAIDLAGPSPSDRWLDVGTGTGALLHELVRCPQRPGRVVGIDSSSSMLAQVGPLPAGWQAKRADARRLPFPDKSFDTVSMAYLLHVLDPADRAATLEEAVRVLRPGGRLVAVTLETRGWPARRALSCLPRRSGLSPLDPAPELIGAGLMLRVGRFVRRGWPSLCILASQGDAAINRGA